MLFADKAAVNTLGGDLPSLLGHSLLDLFPAAAADELNSAFGTVSEETMEFDLPAPRALKDNHLATEVRLFIRPDMSLEDRLLGRVAVVTWDPWENLRDRICDAMDRGDDWKSAFRNILDILRKHEVVPHGRAMLGIFAEKGTRLRLTLVHPQPEMPWPRRWIAVPEEWREPY